MSTRLLQFKADIIMVKSRRPKKPNVAVYTRLVRAVAAERRVSSCVVSCQYRTKKAHKTRPFR